MSADGYEWFCPTCANFFPWRAWHCRSCGSHNWVEVDAVCMNCRCSRVGNVFARRDVRAGEETRMSKGTKERWMSRQMNMETGASGGAGHGGSDPPDDGFRIEVIMMSPARAKRFLENEDENNRPSSHARVTAYAHDMQSGRWHPNGETIKIDRLGRLIDGGHRLRAVIQADVTIRMVVVFNAERDGIDRGRTRSATDARRMRGEPVTALYIASLKSLFKLHRGWNTNVITDDDTYDLEQSQPLGAAWLREHTRGGFPASVFGSIAFTVPVLGARATEFLSQISTLENLPPGASALLFVRQLRTMNTAGGGNSRRIAILTLHALRHFAEGRMNGSFLRPSDESFLYWCRQLGLTVQG